MPGRLATFVRGPPWREVVVRAVDIGELMNGREAALLAAPVVARVAAPVPQVQGLISSVHEQIRVQISPASASPSEPAAARAISAIARCCGCTSGDSACRSQSAELFQAREPILPSRPKRGWQPEVRPQPQQR